MRVVRWAFTFAVTVCVFSIVAAVGLAIWVAWAEPLKAQERDRLATCTASTAARMNEIIEGTANKQGPVVITMPAAERLLKGFRNATQGKMDFVWTVGPDTKLVFWHVRDPKPHWQMFGFDVKDGKECAHGRIGIEPALLEKAVEAQDDPGV